MSRRLAGMIVRLAAALLPPRLRDWGEAMKAEIGSIERPIAALLFALGCLGCALGQAFRRLLMPSPAPDRKGSSLLDRPFQLAIVCAVGATGLGLAYMTAGGAPTRYLAMNCAALLFGLVLVGLARRGEARGNGLLDLALAVALLLTSLFGESAGGVMRWVSVAGILLQPGLFLVPILALRFARSTDALSTVAVLTAALALALQPDRAMAGALAAGMTALVLTRPGRAALIGAGGALAALVATLVRTDPSPAMPFVDGVLVSSFEVDPLAGVAVLGGALLMLLPAAVGLSRDSAGRSAHAVFGAVWLAVILAAILGNYPTPLVGYGGSAIIGYLVSLLGLPPHAGADAARCRLPGAEEETAEGPGHLRAAMSPVR